MYENLCKKRWYCAVPFSRYSRKTRWCGQNDPPAPPPGRRLNPFLVGLFPTPPTYWANIFSHYNLPALLSICYLNAEFYRLVYILECNENFVQRSLLSDKPAWNASGTLLSIIWRICLWYIGMHHASTFSFGEGKFKWLIPVLRSKVSFFCGTVCCQ